ncbi:MAG TPA: LPS assembly protein LptD [Steroidobacteraceae bacterium]|jgi:LPS-assembly protein|nr:LPS assembly protein LptD [Steroidobacteraceae bacterium]
MAVLAAACCVLAAAPARAADMCPAPAKRKHPAVETGIAEGDHRIRTESDGASVDANGFVVLTGHVQIRQNLRTISADRVTYDQKTGKVTVKGSVDFEDPRLGVTSDSGAYDVLGGASFDQAHFHIFDRNGRGVAREMDVRPNGIVHLEKVRYTTCPVGNEDWMMQASSIKLDTDAQQGIAHKVTMRFKDVPVFYTPYIAFPLGDQRQSGLLFPSFGHSGTNGYQLDVPYYFNLAPNYDATLTPGVLSRRGVQLGGEFRFLTADSHGQVEENFLPDDAVADHSNRAFLHITDTTNLAPGLRFDTDIASVSDSNYFSDFAVGADQTSVTFLERRAEFLYYDDVWRIRAQAQNFQTIDTALEAGDRPYSRVPRVEAYGLFPLAGQFEFALSSEVTNFLREVGPTGVRADLSPELRWSARGPGYFFEPAVGYHYTQYDLQNTAVGDPSTPTRTLPYGSLDTGLIFERDSGSQGQRTETLEPRLLYSYVPFRNQNELPIFDTGLPDLNLVELFRTNRYVGDDRIGDANQLAMGLTTRLFSESTGTQYLSATLGQIRYFSIPRVFLPDEITQTLPGQTLATVPGQTGQVILPYQNLPTLPGQTLATVPGQTFRPFHASDVVAEVAVNAYKNWSVNLDYQWNPYTSQTDKSEVLIQYHPDSNKVVNVGYRFQQDILKQYDVSFAWPIAGHWNTVGRYVYSIQDRQVIEQLAGVEYKSCCWRIQVLQRRYLTNRTGGLDTSIALQLELTGLSSVGKRSDAFLSKEISGYSTRDPNAPEDAR